ncbi:hypothetical protein AX774_g1640 [Zancudomyces culisetae]|uniref:SMP-LTD domain-containing protein n=1 Tax=Zancudomyces culisetae TaxID=1213189 RepID=A0A1R1PV69_ZANCU|nr:hypothetical protein AX774_g1640 [Zancudomyces culisetae]|eukprot:OMH84833.1 hypothetical protein AX774_g1640 [Zancudomyces culisetae]
MLTTPLLVVAAIYLWYSLLPQLKDELNAQRKHYEIEKAIMDKRNPTLPKIKDGLFGAALGSSWNGVDSEDQVEKSKLINRGALGKRIEGWVNIKLVEDELGDKVNTLSDIVTMGMKKMRKPKKSGTNEKKQQKQGHEGVKADSNGDANEKDVKIKKDMYELTRFYGVLVDTTFRLYEKEEDKTNDEKVYLAFKLKDYLVELRKLPSYSDGSIYSRRLPILLKRVNGGVIYIYCEQMTEKEDWFTELFYASMIAKNDVKKTLSGVIPWKQVQENIKGLTNNTDALINALFSRILLGVMNTKLIRKYILAQTKYKFSKMTLPTFLSNLQVVGLDVGENTPIIKNVNLDHLGENGEVLVSTDVEYCGGFSIKLELEVNIVSMRFKMGIAATLKSLKGRLIVKIKRPPSNRIWFGFTKMPQILLDLEPFVNGRQIKTTSIVDIIKKQIIELIKTSWVLPNMDNLVFLKSNCNGGLFDEEIFYGPSNITDESLIDRSNLPSVINPTPPTFEYQRERRKSKSFTNLAQLSSYSTHNDVSFSPAILSPTAFNDIDDIESLLNQNQKNAGDGSRTPFLLASSTVAEKSNGGRRSPAHIVISASSEVEGVSPIPDYSIFSPCDSGGKSDGISPTSQYSLDSSAKTLAGDISSFESQIKSILNEAEAKDKHLSSNSAVTTSNTSSSIFTKARNILRGRNIPGKKKVAHQKNEQTANVIGSPRLMSSTHPSFANTFTP